MGAVTVRGLQPVQVPEQGRELRKEYPYLNLLPSDPPWAFPLWPNQTKCQKVRQPSDKYIQGSLPGHRTEWKRMESRSGGASSRYPAHWASMSSTVKRS